MNSITFSSLAKSVVGNPLASSMLALAVWIAGAMSGSIALMIASGIMAYGRPLAYNALFNSDAKTEKSAKTSFSGLSSIRPSIAAAR